MSCITFALSRFQAIEKKNKENSPDPHTCRHKKTRSFCRNQIHKTFSCHFHLHSHPENRHQVRVVVQGGPRRVRGIVVPYSQTRKKSTMLANAARCCLCLFVLINVQKARLIILISCFILCHLSSVNDFIALTMPIELKLAPNNQKSTPKERGTL